VTSLSSPPKKSSAPALSRGLKVLELIARSKSGLSLSAIARQCNLALSSTHAICTTLLGDGYIEKKSDGRFHLTLKVLDLASAKINAYDIVEHFYEACEEIALIRENAAVISVLDGADVFYIGSRNSPHPLGVTFRVGMRLPACCTASGRALLANLSDEEIEALYPDERIPQVTKASIRTRTELFEHIAKARAQGYAEEKAGTRPHMFSYGALIATAAGKTIAAVAVSLFEADVTAEIEAQAIADIKALANRLSRFGGMLV